MEDGIDLRGMTPEAAAQALRAMSPEQRQAARAALEQTRPTWDLLAFVQRYHPAYLAGWFHRELCRRLEWFSEDVRLGRSPRLIICAPPRHGKSEIVSRRFPVWHMGRNPGHEVIACSYGQSLANDMSNAARKIRARAVELWPHLEAGSVDNTERWETVGGNAYAAAGVGGPITGKGAHVLVIDDPIKSRAEADSYTIRERAWKWYVNDAYSRLAPGGGVLVMATRWHEDDPIGRLIQASADGSGDRFEVVSYPALAERDEAHRLHGEALHPERYPANRLRQIREVVGRRAWLSLYQQRPPADSREGLIYDFDASIHRVPAFDPPREWPRYRAVDFGTRNPTCCLWIAHDEADDVLHVYREYYEAGRTARQNGDAVNRLSLMDPEAAWTVVDPEDRGARLVWAQECGIATSAAKKDIRAGIDAVSDRLRPDAEGKAHLVIHDCCVNLLRELPLYAWATSRGGSDNMEPDKPAKRDDHAVDALRYGVYWLAQAGQLW